MISLLELLNEELHMEEYTVENHDDIKEFVQFKQNNQ